MEGLWSIHFPPDVFPSVTLSGYRKIPGDVCKGDLKDYVPTILQCAAYQANLARDRDGLSPILVVMFGLVLLIAVLWGC